LVIRVATEA
jgi:hypothetical protein